VMGLSEYLAIALDGLEKHRLRSTLTMLGIVVGVVTVMLTIGLGAGARASITNQISSLGSNLIVVNSGPPPGPQQQAVYLYPADARAILERCPLVTDVAPQQETRLPGSAGAVHLSSNFGMGVTAAYAHARRLTLASGRFLDANDDTRAAKVVVVGSTVRDYLFGEADPIGRRVIINGVDFEVVGILDQKGDGPGLGPGMSTDD